MSTTNKVAKKPFFEMDAFDTVSKEVEQAAEDKRRGIPQNRAEATIPVLQTSAIKPVAETKTAASNKQLKEKKQEPLIVPIKEEPIHPVLSGPQTKQVMLFDNLHVYISLLKIKTGEELKDIVNRVVYEHLVKNKLLDELDNMKKILGR